MLKRIVLLLLPFFCFSLGFTYGQNGNWEGFSEPERGPLPLDIPSGVKDSISKAYGIPNVLLQNDYNMFYAPGTLLKYGTAYAELWQGNPWGGATFRLPFGLKAALFVGRAYNGFIYNNMAMPVDGNSHSFQVLFAGNYTGVGATTLGSPANSPMNLNLNSIAPQHSVDVLLGRKLGGKMAIGMKYSVFQNSKFDEVVVKADGPQNPDDGKLVNDKSYLEQNVSLGVTLDNFLWFFQLDLAVDMTLSDLDFSYSKSMVVNKSFVDTTLKSAGAPSFNFLLRPIFKVGEDGIFIVMLDFFIRDTSVKAEQRIDKDNDGLINTHGWDVSYKYSYADNAIGGMPLFALHTKPRDDLKIIYSAGCNLENRVMRNTDSTWSTNNTDVETVKNTLQVPVSISLEYEVLENLKLRLGFMKFLLDQKKYESKAYKARFLPVAPVVTATDPQDNTTSFRTTFGAGYRWKDFEIDVAMAVLAYNFNGLFTSASIKYHY